MSHHVQVEAGLEFPGEIYIWCTCDVRPETISVANQLTIHPQDRSVFRGGSFEELQAFLREHAPVLNGHRRTTKIKGDVNAGL